MVKEGLSGWGWLLSGHYQMKVFYSLGELIQLQGFPICSLLSGRHIKDREE